MRSTQANSGLESPKSTEVRPLTVGWSTVDRCPIGCVMHQSSPAHGRRLHVLCLGCPGPPARKAIRHHHWMGWAGGAVEPRTITGRTRCNSGQHTPTICLSRLHFFLNQCIAPASGFFLPSARRHIESHKSCQTQSVDQLPVNEFDDAAYNMAAVTATIALYRALVRKGVLAREEARQILLDAAISRSIEA